MPRRRLRIIGGSARGRCFHFPAGPRPTPAAVRETVFNWLQPMLTNAHCLDLFAGSGMLGLEAASRGAGAVVLVDNDAAVARRLGRAIADAALANVHVIRREARGYLRRTAAVFDIVFIDPPYGRGLLQQSCALLEQNALLSEQARVYLECERALRAEDLPANWRIARAKNAGQVHYHLAVRAPA